MPAESNSQLRAEMEALRARLAELERAEETARALIGVGRELVGTLDPAQSIDRLVTTVLDLFKVRRAVLYRIEPASGTLLCVAVAGEGDPAKWIGRTLEPDVGIAGLSVSQGEPVWSPDPLADPRVTLPEWARRRFQDEGYRSVAAVPLIARGKVLGTLVLGGVTGRVFTDEELGLLATFADQAALAIQNADLFEETQQRLTQMETLLSVSQTVGSTLELTEVLRRATREMVRALGADMGGAWFLAPTRDGFLPLVGYHIPKDILATFGQTPFGLDDTVIAEIRRLPEAIYASDSQNDPRFDHPLIRLIPHRSILVQPVWLKGEIIGGFAIAWVREPHWFTPGELRLVEAIMHQAALAIDNARLFGESERRRRVAETLAEVGRLISESLDPEDVGRRIADSVLALLGGQVSVLFRMEPGSGDLVALAVSGNSGSTLQPGTVFHRGSSASGLAIQERRPVVSRDILDDPRIALTPEVRAAAEQAAYRSVLSVPLMVKAQVVGALGIGDRSGRVFESEDIKLAQAFADQAALALENARLYGELREAVKEVELTQQRIVQAERLLAVGELSSGVAHHLNNLLMVILARIEILMARIGDAETRRSLQIVEQTTLGAAEVVRRLHGFARLEPLSEASPCDLNDLAREALELTRPLWQDQAQARGVSILPVLELGEIPPALGDPVALREVVTNLIVNALDAEPEGGRITVKTWAADNAVYCAVADTGIGMSPEVRRRAVEPFFTTKGVQATGLGLSVAHGIVQRHGGAMTIESAEGTGTTVTLRLCPAQAAAEIGRAEVTPAVPRSPMRVLVVEDEAEVRRALADALGVLGHSVVQVAGGREALARLEAGEAVDLVLTDLGMPEMNGWQVARVIRARWPGLPVGIVTGWADTMEGTPEDRRNVEFVIGKPVRLETLREALGRIRP
jgi:GAF domain-containing protein/CheY-like chemotaxis protein/anti-sigma regulatory factor (Ser/Thr protein kinase)